MLTTTPLTHPKLPTKQTTSTAANPDDLHIGIPCDAADEMGVM
jgi:hypothetical protein